MSVLTGRHDPAGQRVAYPEVTATATLGWSGCAPWCR